LFSSLAVNKRGMVQKEYKLALEVLKTIPFGQIFIIPVRLDDCEIPDPFKEYQYVDLFPEWKKGINKILESLGKKSSNSDYHIKSIIKFELR
jgi:hypothetical protein